MTTATLEQIMASAKAQREQDKIKADAEKAAKKEATEKRKAEQEVKKAEREKLKEERDAKKTEKQPEQNGVRRPRPDTLCGAAWATMDKVTLEAGRLCLISEVIASAQADNPEVNLNNLRGEFVRWKKFNGLN